MTLVNRSMTVKGHITDVPIQFLVDTGASCTIISENSYMLIRDLVGSRLRKLTGKMLQLADGQPLDTLGTLMVDIRLGPVVVKHNVLVAKISDEGIIGYDFLYTHGCTIDVGQHEFWLQGMKIPCTTEGGTQGNVRLSLVEVPREEAIEKTDDGEEEEQNVEGEVKVPISPYVEVDGFPLAEDLCGCISEENRDNVFLVRDDVFVPPESEQLIEVNLAYCATGKQETANVQAAECHQYINKSRFEETLNSQTALHQSRYHDQMSPGSGDLMKEEASFVETESVSPEDYLMCAIGTPGNLRRILTQDCALQTRGRRNLRRSRF